MTIDKDKLGFSTTVDTIGVDDRLTKEQFRKFAEAAIESCVALSDELWDSTLVTVVLKFRNSYEVVVGIRDAEEPDDPDIQAQIDTLRRYKNALIQIAGDPKLRPSLQAIAARALGDPLRKKADDEL